MPSQTSVQLLKLDEVADQPVGGKAAGLARLRAMGLRVPDAIVLVGASSDLSLPPDLSERVAELGDGALAVRSSAIGEDGQEASFAGQYETVLGVRGDAALRQAIGDCLDSAESARASAYRAARDSESSEPEVVMSVVIQRMVEARASGVCFTVDPVTSRRNRLVIDSVAGLGEALVSGEASPDHDELLRGQSRWEARQLAGESAVLSERERAWIAAEALQAEERAGEPLDLEWAIDQDGELFWLQARPVTTLKLDPQALDAGRFVPGDVFTRCNVGEMMPGAVSPLTFSTCARGIDVGWQGIMQHLGLRQERSAENVYIAMSHGHLFINLSEGARFSAAVMGSSPDQQSLAICGRLVPEVVATEPPPLHVRLPRITKQLWSILRARPRIRRMEALVAKGAIVSGTPAATARGRVLSAHEIWKRIDARMEDLYEAYGLHLTVSSGAGALAPILLRLLAGDEEPTDVHHATVARLFSGATNVESADIAEGSERVLNALVASTSRPQGFDRLSVEEAVSWLMSPDSGEAGRLYRNYLEMHGHRSLRELDIRQPEWAHDPTPLVRSLQTQLRGRLASTNDSTSIERVRPARMSDERSNEKDPVEIGFARLKRLSRVAHAAVRNRERGKSLLVNLSATFKQAYRALGDALMAEGLLPDADAVYFLFHEELGDLVRGGSTSATALAAAALARREALAYQETLVFPEVAVGLPEPELPGAALAGLDAADPNRIVGKPVSSGRVEGSVRVVSRLEEAEDLEPGEILVAPITDVGWTPYFAIIAGLVTDVGSAVSHGAVVAREFGLPAVLNTRIATQVLKTGDRVRLDGDRGIVTRLESGESMEEESGPDKAEKLGESDRFAAAISAIDAVNAEDPNEIEYAGERVPRCLLDSRRATEWVLALDPKANETLLLAVRAHHLGRFKHPRSEYPDGRAGYHAWRRELQKRHARDAAEILLAAGYSTSEADRVGELIRKQGLGRDADVQAFEDALCLVFIETALVPFAQPHEDEKVVDILMKSLKKMSPEGRAAIARIDLPDREAKLVAEAARRYSQES